MSNRFEERNRREGQEKLESLLEEMNSSIQALGESISTLQENQFRDGTPGLPNVPTVNDNEAGFFSRSLDKASDKIAGNPATNFAANLLKLQKSIEDAASTIGSALTENFNLRGQYGLSQNAQAQTTGFFSDLAASGYQASDSEIADFYLQARQIQQRRYDAERQVKGLTTRGSAITGALGLSGVGVDVETFLQEQYNNIFFRSESSLEDDLRGVIKTQRQSEMQKEINRNNKTSDVGGY